MSGRISFIGAGPGAADLITVRGARRIAEADVVVWAASLVAPECIQEHARIDAELVDSSRLTHEEAIEIYRRAEREKLKVARVHSGDPALWGAVQEQYDACARMQLEVEIVPGVAAFSAAAATAGHELTVPEVAQSLVLTRLEGGKTPMPDGEAVREFAKHGTTMALFLSAARTGQLVEELRAGGYADDVPVLVAYKVSWPDELMLRTTLGELESTVKQHKLWRHTLFIVGRALEQSGTRSRLYNPGHFHTYRRADPAARKALRAEQGGAGRSGAARRSRRSGRSRFDSEGSSGSDAEPEAVPEPRTGSRGSGRSDSDVAWWAVRNWQETARSGPRFVAPASRRGASATPQQDLFVGNEPESDGVTVEVGAPEEATDVVTFSVVAAESDTSAVATGTGGTGAVEDSGPVASDAVSGDVVPKEARSADIADIADGTDAEVVSIAAESSATSNAGEVPNAGGGPAVEEAAATATAANVVEAKPRSKAKPPQGKTTSTKTAGTKPAGAKNPTKATGTKSGQSKRGQGKTGQAKGGARGKSAGARGDAGEAKPGAGSSTTDDRSG